MQTGLDLDAGADATARFFSDADALQDGKPTDDCVRAYAILLHEIPRRTELCADLRDFCRRDLLQTDHVRARVQDVLRCQCARVVGRVEREHFERDGRGIATAGAVSGVAVGLTSAAVP
jgi:hypothetical protein